MTPVPELRTERLVMRGWRDEDYEPFAALMAVPEVGAGLGKEAGLTPHEAWLDMCVMTAHWQLKGFGHWVLETRDDGELVGRAGLYRPPEWPGIEVGWTVARQHWGKGYAPEAARAACDWGNRELHLDHVISLILPTNAQSIRVAEKLGETYERDFNVRGFEVHVYGADLPLGGWPG